MRRFAAVVFCVLSTASLIAQEKADVLVAVANWTSPPYWSAQEPPAKDVEQALQEGETLGIHPMGALPSPSLPLTGDQPVPALYEEVQELRKRLAAIEDLRD